MGVLVLVEHNNHTMSAATRNILAAALELDSKPTLLVVGYQCASVAEQAAALGGVNKVLTIDKPVYAHQLAESVSQLIASLGPSFSVILGASSTYSKNILPRVAAQLDVAQVSDVITIVDGCTIS